LCELIEQVVEKSGRINFPKPIAATISHEIRFAVTFARHPIIDLLRRDSGVASIIGFVEDSGDGLWVQKMVLIHPPRNEANQTLAVLGESVPIRFGEALAVEAETDGWRQQSFAFTQALINLQTSPCMAALQVADLFYTYDLRTQ